MRHEFYAINKQEISGTYRILSDFSDANHGDIVEISFPDKPTKIVLVSYTGEGGCRGCAFDVIEDYCEVVNINGTPLCMACAGIKTIFKNLDSIMEEL